MNAPHNQLRACGHLRPFESLDPFSGEWRVKESGVGCGEGCVRKVKDQSRRWLDVSSW